MGMGGECVGPCSSAGSLTACRFHTGAEQGWTRGMFSSLRVTSTLNITETIKALVVPKAYAPDSTRSSADGPGFNGVCIPDDADLPSSLNYEPYSQKTATPDSNTGTELHTTSMVPRRLRTFGAGPRRTRCTEVQRPSSDGRCIFSSGSTRRWPTRLLRGRTSIPCTMRASSSGCVCVPAPPPAAVSFAPGQPRRKRVRERHPRS
jgi:hypothetical protein